MVKLPVEAVERLAVGVGVWSAVVIFIVVLSAEPENDKISEKSSSYNAAYSWHLNYFSNNYYQVNIMNL